MYKVRVYSSNGENTVVTIIKNIKTLADAYITAKSIKGFDYDIIDMKTNYVVL